MCQVPVLLLQQWRASWLLCVWAKIQLIMDNGRIKTARSLGDWNPEIGDEWGYVQGLQLFPELHLECLY